MIFFPFFFPEKYRVYATISFAVVLFGIGIPLWWYMTTVQRVALPYSGIDELSNLEIRIKTKIIVAALTDERAITLTEEIRKTFENSGICITYLDIFRIHLLLESLLVETNFPLKYVSRITF